MVGLNQKYWRSLPGPQLLKLIIAVSAMAIAYEGMSQGVMGAVNVAPEYGVSCRSDENHVSKCIQLIRVSQQRMGFADATGKVINPSLQGGIVATYYAGSLLGAFWAGDLSDKHGRIKGLKSPMASVFRLADPIGFDAPDEQPVVLLIFLLVPEAATQKHLEILSEIAELLSDAGLREQIKSSTDAQALHALIAGWQSAQVA